MVWMPFSDEFGAEREYDELSDQLSDQRHGWVKRRVCDGVQHRVNVIKLTDELSQPRRRHILANLVVDQGFQDVIVSHIVDLFSTRQVDFFLFLFELGSLFSALLFLLFFAFLSSQGPHIIQLIFYHVIYLLGQFFLSLWHYFFSGHCFIIFLPYVFVFMVVGPFVIVLIIEIVEFSYEFVRTDFSIFIFSTITVILLLLPFFVLLFFLFLCFGHKFSCFLFLSSPPNFLFNIHLQLKLLVKFVQIHRDLSAFDFYLGDP